jgi:predicted TIM-barrel fold metal-dependent hydrolase
VWRKGMAALAALPHVHVKISGLDYIRHGWAVDPEAKAVVKGLVREVVHMFGAGRCMFASNFPVDL